MNILVCTDFSAGAAAGERAASTRFPDAHIIVFHAVDPRLAQLVVNLTGRAAEELNRDMAQFADARMNEVVTRLVSQNRRATAELVEGDPVDAALEAAARHGVDLIVVGVAHGVEVGRFRTRLVRAASIPVLIVPTEA